MILLLVILTLVGAIAYGIYEDDIMEGLLCWLLLGLVPSVVLMILIFIYPYNVTQKLTMYEEENAKIEDKIKTTVQSYMNYEQDTYNKFIENEALEILLVKFPELNSNELVRSEIAIYNSNNKEIKTLKEVQIDKKTIGWWLFFNIGVKD